ncbi:hypothetical protein PGTUg99_030479 [Puccinia graminis f. sp. tritici]|uniref:Uncharacterized protein n=1 Tax=Puccinia graminis f. sp. tritici TaxID=56615 RepID=A0A5B0R757_PUCGR|nr:hypothetical protein PGTUg99_030479 [Puccinia graminis f. sp. tritici]
MAPVWILCRCKQCMTFNHVGPQGDKIAGREWKKDSKTYKDHRKPPATKSSTSCSETIQATDSHRTNKNSVSEVAHTVSLHSTRTARASKKSFEPNVAVVHPAVPENIDPNLTAWNGRTMSCGKCH